MDSDNTRAIAKPIDPVAAVVDMVVQGSTIDQVVQYGMSEWGWDGEDDPRARAAVTGAVERFAALSHMDADVRTGVCIGMIQDVYRRASEQNDLPTMLRAARELSKIELCCGGEDAD